MMTIRTVLVPVDGSSHANSALDAAAELAARFDAKLVLLHVMTRIGSNRVPEELRGYVEAEHVQLTENDVLRAVAEEIVNAAAQRLVGRSLAVETLIETGNPAQVIAGAANRIDADLIVMGRRGLGDLQGLLVGSVTHKVQHITDRRVLTVI